MIDLSLLTEEQKLQIVREYRNKKAKEWRDKNREKRNAYCREWHRKKKERERQEVISDAQH